MSKKDYIKFAKMIADQKAAIEAMNTGEIFNTNTSFIDGYGVAVFNMAHNMADAFAEDNPRFDRNRFLKACGVS